MAEMNKDSVAEILSQIATMLELKGENVFKIRAYQNAARAMETFSGNLAQVVGEGKLAEVPGIGKAIAEKVTESAACTGLGLMLESVTVGLTPMVRACAMDVDTENWLKSVALNLATML